jgi:hypothetical protein
MLTHELLQSYRAIYMLSQKESQAKNEPAKHTGLTLAYLLSISLDEVPVSLTPVSSKDEKNDDSQLDSQTEYEKHRSALRLAIEIDLQDWEKIDSEAQNLVKALEQYIKIDQKATGLRIGSLEEAVKLLQKHPEFCNQTPHVLRVFKAILMAYGASNEDLNVGNALLHLNLPREGDNEFLFYFHRENYSTAEERRKALNRLVFEIIAAWNFSASNQQLEYFLNSIKAGPCIEGATRKALKEVVAKKSSSREILPMNFRDALDQFYHQAENLLQGLRLPVLPHNLMSLILAAYNGRECLAHADKEHKNPDPTLISASTVRKYIDDLGIHSSHYRSQETEKTLSFPDEIAITTRLAMLAALRPHTASQSRLDTIRTYYRKLLALAHEDQVINVADYIDIIATTNTVNACLYANNTLLLEALRGYTELAVALLIEFPELNLNQMVHGEMTLLHRISSLENGLHIFNYLLKHHQSWVVDIPVNAWCQASTAGQRAGESPLFWLTANPDFVAVLKELFQVHPKLMEKIPVEAWCRPVELGEWAGSSPVYLLMYIPQGKKILEDVFQVNPELMKDIPLEVWCRPIQQGEHEGCSLLYWLTATPASRILLMKLFETNPDLMKTIPAAAWCKPREHGEAAGYTPLDWLALTSDGQVILEKLFQANPGLMKTIPAGVWFRPYRQKHKAVATLFDLLVSELPGKRIMIRLLEENPAIIMLLTPNHLLNPAAPDRASMKDLLNDDSLESQRIIQLLSQNPAIQKIYLSAKEEDEESVSLEWSERKSKKEDSLSLELSERKSTEESSVSSKQAQAARLFSVATASSSSAVAALTAEDCLSQLNEYSQPYQDAKVPLRMIKKELLMRVEKLLPQMNPSELLRFRKMLQRKITKPNAFAILKTPNSLFFKSAKFNPNNLNNQKETKAYKLILEWISHLNARPYRPAR